MDKRTIPVSNICLLYTSGGVKYLGGTCETYGNINTSDSLWAIKHLVFDTKRYTLGEIEQAVLANYSGYEDIRKACLACDKYGNDLETADTMANSLYAVSYTHL